MKQRIKAAVASAPHENLKVFHELSPDLYSAKSDTFIGRVYALFGLKNIADDARRHRLPAAVRRSTSSPRTRT